MGIWKYIIDAASCIREFNSANFELQRQILEQRERHYKRSCEDGSLEKTVKIGATVAGSIALVGFATDNREVIEFGIGALAMAGVYGLAIKKYNHRKNDK